MRLDDVMQAVDDLMAEAHAILKRHGGPVEAAFEEIGERMKVVAGRKDLEELRDASPLPGTASTVSPRGSS